MKDPTGLLSWFVVGEIKGWFGIFWVGSYDTKRGDGPQLLISCVPNNLIYCDFMWQTKFVGRVPTLPDSKNKKTEVSLNKREIHAIIGNDLKIEITDRFDAILVNTWQWEGIWIKFSRDLKSLPCFESRLVIVAWKTCYQVTWIEGLIRSFYLWHAGFKNVTEYPGLMSIEHELRIEKVKFLLRNPWISCCGYHST